MIQAIIIEDEPLAAQRLQVLLEEVSNLIQLQATLDTVEAAVAYLQLHVPELIFLDINLFDRPSFEIFDLVEVRSPIIFTTAYSEFAIKAFEQNSIDYLLKPISKEALARSIQKFFTLKRQVNPSFQSLLAKSQLHFREKFLIKQGLNLCIIQVKDIAYFYSEDKLSFIITNGGKRFPLETSLNEIETSIDPKLFFRINRKFVIRVEAIQSMTYLSKSKLKLTLVPRLEKEELIIVAIEKVGSFRRWLAS